MNKVLLALVGLLVLSVLWVLQALWELLGRTVEPGPPEHRALPARKALRVLQGKEDLPDPAEVTVRQVHVVPEAPAVQRVSQAPRAIRDPWVRKVK